MVIYKIPDFDMNETVELKHQKYSWLVSLIILFVLILLLDFGIKFAGPELANFKVVFLGIVLEALPFILIGVVVSALLETFISEEFIYKVLPKNRYASIMMACCLGIVFPICECGIVPVARRLVSKGVPLYSAVAFMLAAPIINPVVISSTAVAFSSNHTMVWLRMGAALLVSFATALVLSFSVKGTQLNPNAVINIGTCSHDHGCDHDHRAATFGNRIVRTIQASCDEFFEMGKYLIIGAFLGALAQTFIPRSLLSGVGQNHLLSIIIMVGFAFAVSVCSSADAFIAASFAASFSPGALLAFMVMGPMVDIKNTLMLFKAFKSRFVLFMIPVIIILVVSAAYMINIFGG
ncbi:MAG: permease [Syntrophomonas sp.]